jgi:hypothetical protein
LTDFKGSTRLRSKERFFGHPRIGRELLPAKAR